MASIKSTLMLGNSESENDSVMCPIDPIRPIRVEVI